MDGQNSHSKTALASLVMPHGKTTEIGEGLTVLLNIHCVQKKETKMFFVISPVKLAQL